MPTGCTADIYEGKEVSFKDYALTCARTFGAYVILRDNPKAKLPTEFEPNTYYCNKLDEATKKLQELLDMTEDQRNIAAVEYNAEKTKYWKEGEQRNYELTRRYDLMLEKARKYVPPTHEHERFARFLVEQLEESKKFDCHVPGEKKWYTEPVAISGSEWYTQELERTTNDVKYYSNEWIKEQEKTKERNEWIKALFQSLSEEE